MTPLDRLRGTAVARAGFGSSSLTAAVGRMGFVQFDPLRCPAPAQDLILRNRVRGYRAGGLARSLGRLGLEEGFLHVYGAMTAELAALSDPRAVPDAPARRAPSGLAADVLDVVTDRGRARTDEVAVALGGGRATNAWGSTSRATTCALEELHRTGWLRVRRRVGATKVYSPAPPPPEPVEHDERADRLTRHLTGLLAPVTVSTLRGVLGALARRARVDVGDSLIRQTASGRLVRHIVDGVAYVDRAGDGVDHGAAAERVTGVRLLAPFDPLVWDRRRFEHLWGWRYRFEAYTPDSRRRYGYYSLPLLRGASVVGWAHCSLRSGRLDAKYALVSGRSADRGLRRAIEADVFRMATTIGAEVVSIG